MNELYEDISKVLISKEKIDRKVAELGSELSRDYDGLEPVMICVLKGSAIFFSDLCRRMSIPMQMDFIAVSSYGRSTGSSGEVRLIKDLDASIEGRHAVVVEDILDTGFTLRYLKEMLGSRRPATLKICTLLDKPDRRSVEIDADYRGFVIPNEFVVGYGLDYAERFRNLPEICVLKESVYRK
jgi:hypoxanthine phosphoribosyltransferase